MEFEAKINTNIFRFKTFIFLMFNFCNTCAYI